MDSRPSTAPDFLLSRPHGSVRTQGCAGVYTDPYLAAEKLKSGEHTMLVGALPFDLANKCSLRVPEKIIRSAGPLEPPLYYRRNVPLHAKVTMMNPTKEIHLQRVRAAIETIKNTRLDKVVLARSVGLKFETDSAIDPLEIAARLIQLSPEKNAFLAEIGEAADVQRWIVGSSPEVLIRKRGSKFFCYPLAGSAARNADQDIDQQISMRLLQSQKNRDEHAFVVNHIASTLAPVCTSLSYPRTPELKKTAEMWHLATPISGELQPGFSALELALRLHPTPAICGTPTEIAKDLILQVEADRSFYAGAVGWCDSAGDGEFMVAIRCAETDGFQARAWAGGGLVASSQPVEEVAETDAKLRTIMRALGL
jgi:hypothetical protein